MFFDDSSGSFQRLRVCCTQRHYVLSSTHTYQYVGSGPRYMICVTLFCTLHASENTRICENCMQNACDSLHNVQKRATKSDTSGHCLPVRTITCVYVHIWTMY